VGDSTDIVNKEMYTFIKEERTLTLRPEGTAGVVRAFIEQGLHRQSKPVKLCYTGAMFRYERPQEGRQRQFNQIGLEQLGIDTPQSDVEVILLALEALKRLGITNTTLHLNSVGTAEDRLGFMEALKELLRPHLPGLCDDCKRRFEQNPIRMLDCKVPTCKQLYDSPLVLDFLDTFAWSEATTSHFKTVCSLLSTLNVAFVKNPKLVRGLDYYTGTVFEITTDLLGSQGAVCGGGRYNNLVEVLGGPATPAIGWAMGVERLAKLANISLTPPVVMVGIGSKPAVLLALAQWFREEHPNHIVEVDLTTKALNKQLQQAQKRGASSVFIVGDDEWVQGMYALKNLETGEQVLLSLPEIVKHLTL
jgi:histidyl-tRNA synthetase